MLLLSALVLLALCVAPLIRVRAPWWQVAALVLACAGYGGCLWLPTGQQRAGWQGALAIGLASAVVPMALAAGDPVRRWRAAFGGPRLDGRLVRWVAFPLVAAVVSAVVLTGLYVGGAVQASTASDSAWSGVLAASVAVGALVCLPLLTGDLLPSWVSPAMRAGLAALDGVVDAVPGIVVMTTVDWTVGQTLLAVAEAVAVPVMLWVVVAWSRDDERLARRLDAELDAEPHDATPWWEQRHAP